MAQDLSLSSVSNLLEIIHSKQMLYYFLTASCLLLVAQSTPLSLRDSIILDNSDDSTSLQQIEQSISPYSYFPQSSKDQFPSLNLPTEDQLFAFAPSTEDQPFAFTPLTEDQLFSFSPSTENEQSSVGNILPQMNENQLEAAAPATSNGCDNPDTCKLCVSQNQCGDAEVSIDSSNAQRGKICPTGSVAEDQCITYIRYSPSEQCAGGGDPKHCQLCHPDNPGNCVPASVRSKTKGNRTITFICPQANNAEVNCIKYGSEMKCTSPDGTSCQK